MVFMTEISKTRKGSDLETLEDGEIAVSELSFRKLRYASGDVK